MIERIYPMFKWKFYYNNRTSYDLFQQSGFQWFMLTWISTRICLIIRIWINDVLSKNYISYDLISCDYPLVAKTLCSYWIFHPKYSPYHLEVVSKVEIISSFNHKLNVMLAQGAGVLGFKENVMSMSLTIDTNSHTMISPKLVIHLRSGILGGMTNRSLTYVNHF